MQKPATPGGGPCPRCQGQKMLKDGTKVVACVECKGTGQSGYIVKGR